MVMAAPLLDATLLYWEAGAGLRETESLAVGVAVPELGEEEEEDMLEGAPEARGSMDEIAIELVAGAGVGWAVESDGSALWIEEGVG